MNESTALIWGASGGIGRALVSTLQAAGLNTIAVTRNSDNLVDISDQVVEIGDFAQDSAVQTAVREVAYYADQVDLWIYAAGDILSRPVVDLEPREWGRILNANLTGPYLTLHHSMPLLAERSHIMFIGAIQERLRLPGLGAYAAAKAGLEALAESVRKEQRRRTVTVIRPGAVDTPLWDKVPLRVPRDAMAPSELAQKIYESYQSNLAGQVDFAH